MYVNWWCYGLGSWIEFVIEKIQLMEDLEMVLVQWSWRMAEAWIWDVAMSKLWMLCNEFVVAVWLLTGFWGSKEMQVEVAWVWNAIGVVYEWIAGYLSSCRWYMQMGLCRRLKWCWSVLQTRKWNRRWQCWFDGQRLWLKKEINWIDGLVVERIEWGCWYNDVGLNEWLRRFTNRWMLGKAGKYCGVVDYRVGIGSAG